MWGVYTHIHMHAYTVEYYSAINKNGTLQFATIWMYLELTMLNEKRQRQILCYHLYVKCKKQN